METKRIHSILILSLIITLYSCGASDPLCSAYAYAETIKEDNIDSTKKQVTNLIPPTSKGLKQNPEGFQWEDSLKGPNGGDLY